MGTAGSLADLTSSYLDLRWHFDPVDASAAGLQAHDSRLGSFTDADIKEHTAALRAIMGALEAFEVDNLDDDIDLTAVLNDIRFREHRLTVERPHRRDPGFWLSHLFEGLYFLLVARDRAAPHRAQAVSARLRAVPAYLQRARDTLGPCPEVLRALARDVASGGQLLIDEIATHLRSDCQPDLETLCAEAQDALRAFADYLDRDLRETATAEFAIGEQAFNFRLQFQHALRANTTELLRYGVSLVQEVERGLADAAAELSPGTAWSDLVDKLRDTHPEADGLVGAYAGEMERARQFVLARELADVPDGRLDVIATPSFLRPLVPFAAYQPPGAFSPDRTGWFYVSEPDGGDPAKVRRALRDHCMYEIPSTALHEGYPGHHLQFLRAQAQPRLVRRVLGTPVTIEGWALYCEEMMGEEGFYGSAEDRFFQRVALLWRALRVVLDVGLHTGTVGFDEAVQQLEQRMHFTRAHAEGEVRRYCAEPAYQLAYAVGRRELRALRDDFRRASGSAYRLRDFHEAVLPYGGLPVSLIRWGLGLNA